MKLECGIRARWAVPMTGGSATVHEDFFVAFDKGQIKIAESFKSKHRTLVKKFIDAKNHVLIPGLINGHAHLPMTPFRGVEDDAPLHTWLFERILPLEAKFVNKKFVRAGVELAALECTRFGVTTVNDMYFYSEECAKTWDQAGLRGIFYQVFTDFEMPEDKELGPDRFERFRKNFAKYKNHKRIRFGLGPHAPYTCSDELLKKIASEAQSHQCPIQIHLSETKTEVEDSYKKFGKSPVERLRDLQILSPRTNCAHGVHLSDDDISILKETGASVVHNPDSNTKLASGVAPLVKLKNAGVKLGIGTDGVASNNDHSIFGAMDLATKVQKLTEGRSDTFWAADALRMATLGGAEALGVEDKVGSIEVGKRADLVLVDFNHPHLQPVNDVVSHLVFSCGGLEVDTVICDGKVILKNGKHTLLSKEKILKAADKFRTQITQEVQRLRNFGSQKT